MSTSPTLLLILLSTACGGGGVEVIPAATPDNDEDGFDADEDCDDRDPEVWPGAPEIPDDGVDQDCDGADAQTRFGYVDDTEATTYTSGYLLGNALTVDNELVVTHLGFVARWPMGQLKAALYADDDGLPGALVAWTEPSSYEAGLVELPVLDTALLEPGTYWIQLATSEGSELGAGPDATVAYVEHAFDDAFPDPHPEALTYEGPRVSVFLTGELP